MYFLITSLKLRTQKYVINMPTNETSLLFIAEIRWNFSKHVNHSTVTTTAFTCCIFIKIIKMNPHVESYIQKNIPWSQLPESVQQQLGNSQKEYDKCVVTFSVRNQVRFRGSLVRHVRKDEKKVYLYITSSSWYENNHN